MHESTNSMSAGGSDTATVTETEVTQSFSPTVRINTEELERAEAHVEVTNDISEDGTLIVTPSMPAVKTVVNTTDASLEVARNLIAADTPTMRASKIQAMADAAHAHARLAELGIYNNKFLITNDPVTVTSERVADAVTKVVEKRIEEAKAEETETQIKEVKNKVRRAVILTIVSMAILAVGAGAAIYHFVL